eukprot:scaffold1013_cov285-Pavlova_lutheri.AAC.1
MGRRHPAPGATKRGTGGASSRCRKRSQRDNLTLPPSLDGSERDASENSAPSKSKRRNGHPADGSSTSRTWSDEGRPGEIPCSQSKLNLAACWIGHVHESIA